MSENIADLAKKDQRSKKITFPSMTLPLVLGANEGVLRETLQSVFKTYEDQIVEEIKKEYANKEEPQGE